MSEEVLDETVESSPTTDVLPEKDEAEQSSEDFLSMVKRVVENQDEKDHVDSQSAETPSEESAEVADEELPFHKHPRFQKLVKEKNAYKEAADEYQKLNTFLSENNLTSEEVSNQLKILANLKSGNSEEGYQALKKLLDNASVIAGVELPNYLQEKVEDGSIDEGVAKSIWQEQIKINRELDNTRLQKQKLEKNVQQSAEDVITQAINDWETRILKSNPDYELQKDFVYDKVRNLVAQSGKPTTAAQAIQYAEKALELVNTQFKKITGAKAPIHSLNGAYPKGNATAQPSNLLEVIEQVVSR